MITVFKIMFGTALGICTQKAKTSDKKFLNTQEVTDTCSINVDRTKFLPLSNENALDQGEIRKPSFDLGRKILFILSRLDD